jgi:glycosyltransferase involved in cell wall biosynthesis
MKNKLKVAIIITVIPSYREGFYDKILNNKNLEITIYAQTHIPGMNLKTIHNRYVNNVKLVSFFCAEREKIGLQFLPLYEIFTKYDLVVVEGNPRQITHFFLATALRIFRKKVILWTMAHSFRGVSITEDLRLYWSKLFKFIFVYTDKEVAFLRSKGFKNQFIVGMNNGLNQKKIDASILKWNEQKINDWLVSENLHNKTILLSSARLESKNKLDLIISALPKIITIYPNILWIVIGKGIEEERLKQLTIKNNLTQYVSFVGEIYEEDNLAPFFLSSKLFLHPASIGLSLLHAFGYGLPVITHGNAFLHNPEYGAFQEGITGLNFVENNVDDLASTILKLLNDTETMKRMSNFTKKIAREDYNTDVMAKRFMKIINLANENKP